MADKPMTVAQLRTALAEHPDDLPVIVSRDPEGNGFKALWEVAPSRWFPDEEELVSDEDGGTDGVACLVLWP